MHHPLISCVKKELVFCKQLFYNVIYFKRFSRLENDRCIANTGNVFWLSSLPDHRLSDSPPPFSHLSSNPLLSIIAPNPQLWILSTIYGLANAHI
jgi:hypothetical protein